MLSESVTPLEKERALLSVASSSPFRHTRLPRNLTPRGMVEAQWGTRLGPLYGRRGFHVVTFPLAPGLFVMNCERARGF